MRNFCKKILLLFLPLLFISCGEPPLVLYRTDDYRIYKDSISQPPHKAVFVTPKEIHTNYINHNRPRKSNLLELKFAINGKDNEMPVGITHKIYLPRKKEHIVVPVIHFGQQYMLNGETSYLDGSKAITIQVDLNPVFNSFDAKGYYLGANGETVLEKDFKGVWLVGNIAPLSWDFEQLARTGMKLESSKGNGIYQITLELSPYENLEANGQWMLNEDVTSYPFIESPYPVVDAMYNFSLCELESYLAGTHPASTCDVAYATLLSLAVAKPEAAKALLMKRVRNYEIIQDGGTGGAWPICTDRLIWALAAWEIFKVSGDTNWMENSFSIVKKTVDKDLHSIYNYDLHLVRGESSYFDDHEQIYPNWMEPVDIFDSYGLSTNAIYYQTFRVLTEMAKLLNRKWEFYHQKAEYLKKSINKYFWNEKQQVYAQYLYGKKNLKLSGKVDVLGTSLCIIFRIAGAKQEKQLISRMPNLRFGVPCVFPQSPNAKTYYNNAVWPFVQALYVWAGIKTENENAVLHGIGSIYRQASLLLSNNGFVKADNGAPPHHEDNLIGKLPSIAGNLSLVFRMFFGMSFNPHKIIFKPIIPEKFKGEYHLRSFRYRDGEFNISVKGFGKKVSKFLIDGVEEPFPILTTDKSGPHKIEIIMDNVPFEEQGLSFSSNIYHLSTPKLTLSGNILNWTQVTDADAYEVYQNGKLIKTTSTTVLMPEANSLYDEFQVRAIDKKNEIRSSFFSKSIALYNHENEILVDFAQNTGKTIMATNYTGNGYSQLDLNNKKHDDFYVDIPSDGNYRISFRYANGSGPVKQGAKCAIRILYMNQRKKGIIVMPQRGENNWNDWGYTNPIDVKLKEGSYQIGIDYEQDNKNMSSRTNTALLDCMKIIKTGK